MKNFKLLFSVAVAAAMFGCSSMEISDEEAYNENLPSDFRYAEYMAIHPTLRNLQIKDYITAENEAFKESEGEAFAEKKTADSLAFEADLDMLKNLYLDPYIGGYTEEEWAEDFATKTVDDTIAVDVYKVNKDTSDGTKKWVVDSSAALTVYLCSASTQKIVSKKKNGVSVISQLDGVIGEECTESPKVKVNVSDTTYVIVDSTFKTTPKEVSGSIPADKMKALRNFNVFSTTDDWAVLQAVPVDTFAISYQFVLFGKLHGWAYRPCTESEAAKDAVVPEYPAAKLYCDDNGKTKEID